MVPTLFYTGTEKPALPQNCSAQRSAWVSVVSPRLLQRRATVLGENPRGTSLCAAQGLKTLVEALSLRKMGLFQKAPRLPSID